MKRFHRIRFAQRMLTKALRSLLAADRITTQRRHVGPNPANRLLFESLEPRILLSADLAIDLTLPASQSPHLPGEMVSTYVVAHNLGDEAVEQAIKIRLVLK